MEVLKRCSLRALPRAGAIFSSPVPPLSLRHRNGRAGAALSRSPERMLSFGSAAVGPLTRGPLVAAAAGARVVGGIYAAGERGMSGFGRRNTMSPEAAAAAAQKKKQEAEARAVQVAAQTKAGDDILQQARAKLAAGDLDAARALKHRAAQEYKYGSIDKTAELSAFDNEVKSGSSTSDETAQAKRHEEQLAAAAIAAAATAAKMKEEERVAAEDKKNEEMAAATAAAVAKRGEDAANESAAAVAAAAATAAAAAKQKEKEAAIAVAASAVAAEAAAAKKKAEEEGAALVAAEAQAALQQAAAAAAAEVEKKAEQHAAATKKKEEEAAVAAAAAEEEAAAKKKVEDEAAAAAAAVQKDVEIKAEQDAAATKKKEEEKAAAAEAMKNEEMVVEAKKKVEVASATAAVALESQKLADTTAWRPPERDAKDRLFAAALEAKNQEMEEEKAALDLDSTKYAATMTAAAEAKLQAAPVVAAAAEIHKESNEPVGTVGKGANAESRAERGLAATAAVAAAAAVAVATKVRSAAKAQESEKAAAAVTAATAGTVKAKEFKIKAVAAAAARKEQEAAQAACVSEKQQQEQLRQKFKDSQIAAAAEVAVAAARGKVVNRAQQQEADILLTRQRQDVMAAAAAFAEEERAAAAVHAASPIATAASDAAAIADGANTAAVQVKVTAAEAAAAVAAAIAEARLELLDTAKKLLSQGKLEQANAVVDQLPAIASASGKGRYGGGNKEGGSLDEVHRHRAPISKTDTHTTQQTQHTQHSFFVSLPDVASMARLIGPKGVRVKQMQKITKTRITMHWKEKDTSQDMQSESAAEVAGVDAHGSTVAADDAAATTATAQHDVVDTSVAVETGEEGTAVWLHVKVEVVGMTKESVLAAEMHTRKEVEIEVLRAHMYSIMGANDLAWRKRQQMAHLPELHRKRPIFRGTATLASSVSLVVEDGQVLNEQLYTMFEDIIHKCAALGSLMLFKDYDAVLVVANNKGNMSLAVLAIDHMITNPLIRLESRHWQFLLGICIKKSNLRPVMVRLTAISDKMSRSEGDLCLDIGVYLASAVQPCPAIAVHAISVIEGLGHPITPRLRRSFINYHFWPTPVEDELHVLSTQGVVVGVETLLMILEAALKRKCQRVPFIICCRLLQHLERMPIFTTRTPAILKIDT
eukprot:CAMPEP_0179407970 /NCGR_PEP_ID=MMETSP0799-20121207/1817_1 /TAXON_ID=46947 /ORGANISM="Geminigera cryophila, Strain CCMP2564" /LENGTH=1158 /DNA_ID=CAMNT_0021179347 /DNA_START=25 /DNA_END=3499 /DNA_ORIENTATION=+